ncbi:MAG TPA: hypothetical protein DCS15_04710 [Flavobacteriales bacterium]|jgi:hypothetical protein|nr:hypothetical protein [Salibacteraceae bacterium]HAS35765.1 hypothetical protein [Flavobacteriales bacterium]
MKSYIGLFIISAIFLLSACKKEHFYTRSIVNNTDYNIRLVLFGDNQRALGDTISISSNSTEVIQDHYSQHRPKNGLSCAFQQDAIVVLANGRPAEISKSIFSDDYWEKDLVGKRSLDQDCFFEIEAADLRILSH